MQGAHLCDLYEIFTCACTIAHASRLYIKWSATYAHVPRNSIGDEVVGYLCPFIHRSPIQCGVTLDSVWHTVIHTMIHFGTLSHTAHFGTGHWHTESSHRSSVAWQQPAETQHSESLLIDTLEPEFWKHKNHIGDRSCAKLFKSLCSKLQLHLGTY